MIEHYIDKPSVKFKSIFQQIQYINNEQVDQASFQEENVPPIDTLNQNQEEIDIQAIYDYSQRNVRMTQQLVIQPNFTPDMGQFNNLKQSRQLEALSPRVSRPFFINPSFQDQQKQSLLDFYKGQTYLNENNNLQLKKEEIIDKHSNNWAEQFDEGYNQKRISICLENQNQTHYQTELRNGLIPLRTKIRPESMAIHTYRLLKSRYENLQIEREKQEGYKKKKENKKQQARFKGTTITYDYDGEPIPLRNFKRNQPANLLTKQQESVTVIPLPQNIILPSCLNKKRLQKRKARYLGDEEQKQNKKKIAQQQNNWIYSSGTDFLRKTPVDIKKSKLFKDQKQNDNHRRPHKQVTFTEYKKNINIIKAKNTYQVDLKSQKFNLSNFSSVKQQLRSKKQLKKPDLSQGKVTVNQKIFEKAFRLKSNPHGVYEEEASEQQIKQFNASVNQFRNKTVHTMNRQSFNENTMKINNTRKRQNNVVPIGEILLKQLSFKEQNKDLKNHKDKQGTSILRHSLHQSSVKLGQNHIKLMKNSPKHRKQSFHQMLQKTSDIRVGRMSAIRAFNSSQGKRKLKTKPSYKNIIL